MKPLGYRLEKPSPALYGVCEGRLSGSCRGWPVMLDSREPHHSAVIGDGQSGMLMLVPGYTLPAVGHEGTRQIMDDGAVRWHSRACAPIMHVHTMEKTTRRVHHHYRLSFGTVLKPSHPLDGLQYFQDSDRYRNLVLKCAVSGESPFKAPFDTNRYIYDDLSEYRGSEIGDEVDIYEDTPGPRFRVAFDNSVRVFCNNWEYDTSFGDLKSAVTCRPWGLLTRKRGVPSHIVHEVALVSPVRGTKAPAFVHTGAFDGGVRVGFRESVSLADALDMPSLDVVSLGHRLETPNPEDAHGAIESLSRYFTRRKAVSFVVVFASGADEKGFVVKYSMSNEGLKRPLLAHFNQHDILNTFSIRHMQGRKPSWISLG